MRRAFPVPGAAALAPWVAALCAACSDGPSAPVTTVLLTSPTVTVDGLTWTGTVDVMESFPVQLVGRISIANPGAQSRTLDFANDCTALLRAYRPPVPMAFLVWDQADDADCSGGPRSLDVAPGATVEIASPLVSAATILAGGRPNDEYGISVYARANGRNVELAVGGVDLAVPDR